MHVTRLIAAIAGGALVALPLAASAQAPRPPAGDETIRGTIQSLPSHYTLLLHDVRGFVDNVTLRDDTVLNPDGLALNSGVSVTIIGHVDGHTFDADEIDGPRNAVESPANGGAPPYADQQQSAPVAGYDDPYGDEGYAPPPPDYDYDYGYGYGYPYAYAYPAFGVVIGGFGYYGGPYFGHPYFYGRGGYYYGGNRYYPGTPGYRAPLTGGSYPGGSYPSGGSSHTFSQPSARSPQSSSHASSGSGSHR
jgi:hypothetical protein